MLPKVPCSQKTSVSLVDFSLTEKAQRPFCTRGADDGGTRTGNFCVGSAENENLEKLKMESSLGEVTER